MWKKMLGIMMTAGVCSLLPTQASAQDCSFGTNLAPYSRLGSPVTNPDSIATDVALAMKSGGDPACYPFGKFRIEARYEDVPVGQTYCYMQSGTLYGIVNDACVVESWGLGQPAWGTAVMFRYGCAHAYWRQWLIDQSGWREAGSGNGWSCGPTPPAPPGNPICYWWDDYYQQWNLDYGNGDCISPIVLPVGDKSLKSRDYKLTDVQHGVMFDLDADGVPDTVSWTASGSHLAFLAYDRNGNGKIDNGTELYGNHTYAGAFNGFIALGRDFVAQGEGLLDKLLLWEDENHDGISQPEEIHKLKDEGYVSVGPSYVSERLVDKYGNSFQWHGYATALDKNGQRQLVDIYDVYFRTR